MFVRYYQDNLKKSPQWSELNENDVMNLNGNLTISNDTDNLFNSPKIIILIL